MPSAKDIISTLSRFGACDVSDALVKVGVANGGFIPNLTMQSSPDSVSVGQAYTVLYAPKSDPRPEIKDSYIDQIPPDSVLVLGLPPEVQLTTAPFTKVTNAMYGGLMSTRAQYLKCNGSIILGRIRDLDEHRDLNYPVWSYSVGTTAPTSVLKIVGINVPLDIKVPSLEKDYDLITIQPKDILIADKNGVVNLSVTDQIDEVLDYIPKRVDADKKVAADIKKGEEAKKAQKYWRGKI